jgi:hypothetical protein
MHTEAPFGEWRVSLRPEEVLLYADDPAEFLAKHYGVSKAEYIGWHKSGFCARCSALTAAGKPCKNVVLDGSFVSPKEWVELLGGYCHVHG